MTSRGLAPVRVLIGAGLALATLLLAVTGSIAAEPPKWVVTEHPFPPLTGPYAVGVRSYEWVDANRHEPFLKDPTARRRLLVRIWYPARATPDTKLAPYADTVDEFEPADGYGQLKDVKTNALRDAPLADGGERFPVLVYQPGGGTARIAGTFAAEQLASHGYVVVAADHPGFNETVRYPDGTKFEPDQLVQPKPTGQMRRDVEASWVWLDRVFLTWTADATFELDRIEALDHAPDQPFFHRLDLDHIGMYGWSFGGATSIQMSRQDPRVKAAVDQDGQLFGDVRDKGTSRPFLQFHHGNPLVLPDPKDADLGKELLARVEVWDRSLIAHSTGDWYTVTISRTEHDNFSDAPLFMAPRPDRMDGRRAHQIINAYTLAFFDSYLRGKDSALLAGPSPYPEATFTKKP